MGWIDTALKILGNKVVAALIHPDEACFGAVRDRDSIVCSWSIDTDTIDYLNKHHDSRIILRASDRHANANIFKAIEVSTSKRSACIDLPSVTGMIDMQLGFYNAAGDFSVLESSVVDFGLKIIEPANEEDWFSIESKNIHQEMYERAIRYSTLMGASEGFGSRVR